MPHYGVSNTNMTIHDVEQLAWLQHGYDSKREYYERDRNRWIENGKITKPVDNVTVATTLNDFLNNITRVGNNLRMIPFGGVIGVPTLRVDNVTIGGTQQ